MGNEYIKGGYRIVYYTEHAPTLYKSLMDAYTRGKAVMLTRFLRGGTLYPDMFATVKFVDNIFQLDMINIAHITVSEDNVTVTDSSAGTTYTAGDGIKIDNGVISATGEGTQGPAGTAADLPAGTTGDLLHHNGTTWVAEDPGTALAPNQRVGDLLVATASGGVEWMPEASAVPGLTADIAPLMAAGAAGQVLTKTAEGYEWADAAGGSGFSGWKNESKETLTNILIQPTSRVTLTGDYYVETYANAIFIPSANFSSISDKDFVLVGVTVSFRKGNTGRGYYNFVYPYMNNHLNYCSFILPVNDLTSPIRGRITFKTIDARITQANLDVEGVAISSAANDNDNYSVSVTFNVFFL